MKESTMGAISILTLAYILFLFGVMALCGSSSYSRTFYIRPDNGCYSVWVSTTSGDTRISKPMMLEDASALAKTLNGNMNGKWSLENR